MTYSTNTLRSQSSSTSSLRSPDTASVDQLKNQEYNINHTPTGLLDQQEQEEVNIIINNKALVNNHQQQKRAESSSFVLVPILHHRRRRNTKTSIGSVFNSDSINSTSTARRNKNIQTFNNSGSNNDNLNSYKKTIMSYLNTFYIRSQRSNQYKRYCCIFCSILIYHYLFLCGIYNIQQQQQQQKEHLLRGSNNKNNDNDNNNHSWINPSQIQPFSPTLSSQAQHLIIVAGHSVTISGHLSDADQDESDWYLLPYQRNAGLPQAIIGHISEGIRLAAEDEDSLLVFSGGQTRSSIGPVNEGTSYFTVADVMNLWSTATTNHNINTVRARTTTEEYATDSFQNLLFSICRFYEITHTYPTKITLVSFTFKQHRFESLHLNAIRYPISNFEYRGIDPSSTITGFDLENSTKGEYTNSVVPFMSDPYGCHSDILLEKRKERNPFFRTAPYELTCPDMKILLKWCGPDLIDEKDVPWSSL